MTTGVADQPMGLAREGLDELIAQLLPCARLPAHLSPRDLLDADVEPPEHLAKRVHALRALVRSGGREATLTGRLFSSKSVAEYFIPLLGGQRTESIWVVGCDARLRARMHRCVATGGVAMCSVSVADILRPVLLNGSNALVLIHNHPSGDVEPSREDTELTTRVASASDMLGIRLLDHVIVSASSHFSFLDAGLLPARR